VSLLEIGLGKAGWSTHQSRRAMMRRQDENRLLIVNGHPDPRPARFCAALCDACHAGAIAAGRDADIIALGALFPANGEDGTGERAGALELMRRPARLTVIFPLWLDKPPEIVTRFFELVDRSGDALVTRRRAHLVVTMSLPAFAHRSKAREQEGQFPNRQAISLPGLEIDAVNFVGSVDTIPLAQREEWLYRLRRLGSGTN
jgi:putative NADPH-quinone reductase